jgi:hypothetical protein
MIADYAPPLRVFRPRPRHLGRYVVAGVAAIFAVGVGIAGGHGAVVPAGARTVVVAPGQTLWGIAEQEFPGDDPRLTVDEIVQMNGLRSAVIQPGNVLTLPTH